MKEISLHASGLFITKEKDIFHRKILNKTNRKHRCKYIKCYNCVYYRSGVVLEKLIYNIHYHIVFGEKQRNC